jgi:peptidoglycan/xylan/chitin deacetylase (PgdA/CDA1 family)
MYHQIAEVPDVYDPMGVAMPLSQFEQQMNYLSQANYRCMSLKEAVQKWEKGLQPTGSFKPRSFVITFDDGYRDLYTTVWPVLERLGFTATIFLVAGRIGRPSDWDGQNGPRAAQLMSWSEIREMARSGFSFGNHTLTHPQLPCLNDKQAKREILQSKALIEQNLGTTIDLFSYPYTASDDRIRQMVAESGHIVGCGGDRGVWGLYNLWRSECSRYDSMHSFAWKISTWHQRCIWLREQSAFGQYLVPILRSVRNKKNDKFLAQVYKD